MDLASSQQPELSAAASPRAARCYLSACRAVARTWRRRAAIHLASLRVSAPLATSRSSLATWISPPAPPLRRFPSLPNMAGMNSRALIRPQPPGAAIAPVRAAAPVRSRHFYSTVNPNRNARNSMKINDRCTFYSTLIRGVSERLSSACNLRVHSLAEVVSQ